MKTEKQNPVVLTQREYEVISYIAKGYASKQIARLMHISANGVSCHIQHIFLKTDTDNRIRALLVCGERGIVLKVAKGRPKKAAAEGTMATPASL